MKTIDCLGLDSPCENSLLPLYTLTDGPNTSHNPTITQWIIKKIFMRGIPKIYWPLAYHIFFLTCSVCLLGFSIVRLLETNHESYPFSYINFKILFFNLEKIFEKKSEKSISLSTYTRCCLQTEIYDSSEHESTLFFLLFSFYFSHAYLIYKYLTTYVNICFFPLLKYNI